MKERLTKNVDLIVETQQPSMSVAITDCATHGGEGSQTVYIELEDIDNVIDWLQEAKAELEREPPSAVKVAVAEPEEEKGHGGPKAGKGITWPENDAGTPTKTGLR